MKRTSALFAATAMALSAVMINTPALAAGLPAVTALSLALASQIEEDRFFVRWLSTNDPQPAVRSAARAALASDATVVTFLATGYEAALLRAEQTRQRQTAYTQRTVASHAPQYYPRVHAAGLRALSGSYDELNTFVLTGYAAALELDRRDIADDRNRADLVRQDDRTLVAGLRDNDPGAQVRAWAGRAVAPGASDADVAEFLSYGWVSASGLDLQTHRRQLADAELAWRSAIRGLVVDAQEAERKAREAADEARELARETAARAWARVGTETGPARVAWADAEQVALRQADIWQQVSVTAAGASSPNWLNIAGSAQGTREQWLAELQNAAAQASSWNALHRSALLAETEMRSPEA